MTLKKEEKDKIRNLLSVRFTDDELVRVEKMAHALHKPIGRFIREATLDSMSKMKGAKK